MPLIPYINILPLMSNWIGYPLQCTIATLCFLLLNTRIPTLKSSWYLLPWTDPPFSIWPDSTYVPSAQLTEHRVIGNAAYPPGPLSGLYQSAVIHSLFVLILMSGIANFHIHMHSKFRFQRSVYSRLIMTIQWARTPH
jgi:hypothetical protein